MLSQIHLSMSRTTWLSRGLGMPEAEIGGEVLKMVATDAGLRPNLTAFSYAGFIRTDGFAQLDQQATEQDCKAQLMWRLLSPLSHLPHILKFTAEKQQEASDINPTGSVPDGLCALWGPALSEWRGGHNAEDLDRLRFVRSSNMLIPVLSY